MHAVLYIYKYIYMHRDSDTYSSEVLSIPSLRVPIALEGPFYLISFILISLTLELLYSKIYIY